MSNSNHVHRVVPHNESWAIMEGDSSVPAYIFPDKLSAIKKAQELAEEDDGEVIVKEPEAQKTNGSSPAPAKPQPRREQFNEPDKKGPDLEVKAHAKGWAVYGKGSDQPSFIYKLKAEAIFKAEQLAHRYKSEVLLDGNAEQPTV